MRAAAIIWQRLILINSNAIFQEFLQDRGEDEICDGFFGVFFEPLINGPPQFL